MRSDNLCQIDTCKDTYHREAKMCAILTGNSLPQFQLAEVSSAPLTSLWWRIQRLVQKTQMLNIKSTSTKTTYSAVHLNIRHYKVNLLLICYALPFYSFRTKFWLHRGSLKYEIGLRVESKKTTSIWWKSTHLAFLVKSEMRQANYMWRICPVPEDNDY